MDAVQRCEWVTADPVYVAYHDDEWGRPVHDDTRLFEMLCLEGAQAGLNWLTVLRRRDGYRAVFDNFDAHRLAAYTPDDMARCLADARIVRNRAKVASVVTNARAFLEIQAAFGSFDAYLWRFVDGQPVVNCHATLADVPATTPVSDALSKDLKKRGFGFVGSTICYAYLQACGLVNDHVSTCFLYPCQHE